LMAGSSAAPTVAGHRARDAKNATPEREDLDRQVMGHPNFVRGAWSIFRRSGDRFGSENTTKQQSRAFNPTRPDWAL
jgi:hypothetical protein